MPRWEGDAKARLSAAAMELFVAQGFEDTAVADIAARAGLARRTFFRHFADKREVLFDGQDDLDELFDRIIAEAPKRNRPLAAVLPALLRIAELIDASGEFGRQRQRLIADNPALREREALKRNASVARVRAALIARGVDQAKAALVAEMALAAFTVAYDQWGQQDSRSMVDILTDVVDDLAAAVRL